MHLSLRDHAEPPEFASTVQRNAPLGFGNVHMIVQKAGMFHAAVAAKAGDFASGDHFQLQLGMKLLPVCVS
jgi:hypothetical protein